MTKLADRVLRQDRALGGSRMRRNDWGSMAAFGRGGRCPDNNHHHVLTSEHDAIASLEEATPLVKAVMDQFGKAITTATIRDDVSDRLAVLVHDCLHQRRRLFKTRTSVVF